MRWAMAVGLVMVTAILCVYAGLYHPGLTLEECLSRPAACDGAVIYTPHESTIGDIAEGGFTLRWGHREIQVRGVAPSLQRGTYVQVKGVFHKEGYIDALAIHVGRYRRLKMAASAVGAAIVFFLVWKRFIWDSTARAFTERRMEG
jgi:hypothetical protein